MIIKYILFFTLAAATIALPLDSSGPQSSETEKNDVITSPSIENEPEDNPTILTSDEISKNDNNKDLLPSDVTTNPSDEEKSDLDTANTFGFGYGGWGGYRPYFGGYRPYYGYGGGWRGYGYGGFGGGFGFYGRSYHPWGWRHNYYY
ncbi:uncharacterized protein [Onthophagus taurus]|uniref:uncharacterized protein n=1 Tax=Onthophagus taurus TaxID=166361 RepID=UPI0039BE4E71